MRARRPLEVHMFLGEPAEIILRRVGVNNPLRGRPTSTQESRGIPYSQIEVGESRRSLKYPAPVIRTREEYVYYQNELKKTKREAEKCEDQIQRWGARGYNEAVHEKRIKLSHLKNEIEYYDELLKPRSGK